mmetsp:Transcript_12396/g.15700  ORF Transcript_12396/g.15700 Transcript_12396/m.15700 type:complete len:139 (-) Transcript_12396:196-612(-)
MKFISTFFFLYGLLSLTQLISTNAQSIGMTCGAGNPRKCPGYDPKLPPKDPKPDAKLGAMCCSENQFHLAKRKTKYGCKIWAGAKSANHECLKRASQTEAMEYCENNGARLCTCDELLGKCAKSTGCGMNKQMLWCTK